MEGYSRASPFQVRVNSDVLVDVLHLRDRQTTGEERDSSPVPTSALYEAEREGLHEVVGDPQLRHPGRQGLVKADASVLFERVYV